MNSLDYYFDYLSPYSYFSWQQFCKLTNSLDNTKIHIYPVAMSRLFDHWEIKGPALIDPKRDFMLKNCFRYAKKHNISFTPPKVHPFNPLYALRLSTIECAGEQQQAVVNALWEAIWQKSIPGDNPEALIEYLTEKEIDGAALMERASSKEVRSALKHNCKRAIEQSVFGVPTFKYNDELFWGVDSIGNLNSYIAGDDLFNHTNLNNLLE